MRQILVTQRVESVPAYGEQRDCLDQKWCEFLLACDLLPVLVPNNLNFLDHLLTGKTAFDGILFTGGNNLVELQGDAPNRDKTETRLLEFALANSIPVLGVCRGMQLIQSYFGEHLVPIENHVNTRHKLQDIQGSRASLLASYSSVNAFHRFASRSNNAKHLVSNATTESGVIMSVEHATASVFGIMWHPEREQPFCNIDIELFKSLFCAKCNTFKEAQ